MEPQEYFLSKGCFKSKCLCPILGTILIAFAIVIGIIIGASVAETIVNAMAALITLAITFGLLAVITIIYWLCNRRRKDKECGC